MRPVFCRTVALAFGVLISAASAQGGWIEVGDAGRLPGTAQITVGTGSLTSISGTLLDDTDVDVYRIILAGGGTFSATTFGLTSVDTKLFLFDVTGRGAYVNDDANVFTLQSTLPAGDPLTPAQAGVYYLAIAGFDIDPVSVGGLIFPDPLFPEGVFGPTGPGGGSAVTDFVGTGDFGAYTIELTGAFFAQEPPVTAVPEPLSAVSAGIGMLGLITFQRIRAQKSRSTQQSLRL